MTVDDEPARLTAIAVALLDDLGGGEYRRVARLAMIEAAFEQVRRIILSERPTQRLTKVAGE